MNFLRSICGLTISALFALISIPALASNWPVTAPSVSGLANAVFPGVGDIAFDSVTGGYYGYSGSTWLQMSLTSSGLYYFGDGTVSAPALTFSNDTDTGMYRVGADQLGFSVGGVLGFSFANGGGFVNTGLGISPSASSQYPLRVQRSNSSAATAIGIDNPSTAANSNAAVQVIADNGNIIGSLAAYTSSSTVTPYISSVVLRASNGASHLTLIGGDNSGADVRIWTNGDYTSTGQTASFNGDHSTTLFGLLQLPVQGSGSTPTCGSAQNGSLALTNGHKLCVCNGSAWKNASDGSTGCTF